MGLLKRVLVVCFLSVASWAAVSSKLNIEETDGSPSTFPYKLKVTNGSLTDNGDGTATLSVTGGVGGGGAGVIGGTGDVYDSLYISVPSSNTFSTSSNIKIFPSSVTVLGALPILSTSTLQDGATFFVSSGTITNQLTTKTIIFSTSIAVLRSTDSVGMLSLPNTHSMYLGYNAGGTSPVTTGGSNTCAGPYCMYYPPTGNGNVGFGFSSVHGTSGGNTGSNNTGFGYATLTANSSGSNNTAVGSLALNANTVNGNTAVGAGALQLSVTGGSNTAVGWGALTTSVASDGNTALGYQTLKNLTFGSSNVGVGAYALNQLTTGSENTSVGNLSSFFMTTATKNTAVGYGSLNKNATGYYNTAVGNNALGLSLGSRNTIVGEVAGYGQVSGDGNTVVGFEAGQSTTTSATYPYPSANANVMGSSNTYIGARTGQGVSSNTYINKSIALGFQALVDSSNQAQIGGRTGSGDEVTVRADSFMAEGLAGDAGDCVQIGTDGLFESAGSACGTGGGGGGAGVVGGTGDVYDSLYISVDSSNTFATSGNLKIFPSSTTFGNSTHDQKVTIRHDSLPVNGGFGPQVPNSSVSAKMIEDSGITGSYYVLASTNDNPTQTTPSAGFYITPPSSLSNTGSVFLISSSFTYVSLDGQTFTIVPPLSLDTNYASIKTVTSSMTVTGAGGIRSTYAISGGSLTARDIPSALVGTNSSGVLISTTINLGASNVGGNLPVARLNSGTSASASTFWRGDATWATPTGSFQSGVLGTSWDGSGSVLTTGTTYWVRLSTYTTSTLTGFTLTGKPSGSVSVNVSSSTVFDTAPVSICGAQCPTFTTSTSSSNYTLGGWTTSLPAGGFVYFMINTAATLTQANLSIDYLKQ